MPEFFTILLKINVALIFCVLAYYLVLRRLTFYTLNRVFLLMGIVFSTLYPFIDLTVLLKAQDQLAIPVINQIPQLVVTAASGFDYWLLAKFLFWFGVVLMAIRMIIRFYSLYKVHTDSTPGQLRNHEVRILQGNLSTFSFWKNIYINPELHDPAELDAILAHEQVHVKELHTLDILLAELTTVLYWFNPGVWYMRRAVKENVEFITDQQILMNGADKKAYQYSMLSSSGYGKPSALMNNFNLTGIKRRIIMMNSQRSSRIHLIRYVLLLPVVFILTTAFTFYRKEVKSVIDHQQVIFKPEIILPELTLTDTGPPVKTAMVQGKAKGPRVISARLFTDTTKKRALTIKSFKLLDTFSFVKKEAVKSGGGQIVVTGYAFNPDSVPKGSKVIFVKRKTASFEDESIMTGKQMKFFIDDVEVSADQLKSFEPEDLINMKVNRSEDNKSGEIRIYTRKIKN